MVENPSHIFISYATEDAVFADWLARKLATEGYAVWFDRIKLLGGESWPKSVDVALHTSGRMLALMSASSIEKDLPVKERTRGLRIGRERGIQDFVIPLRLDKSEWDWTFGDTTPVPFEERWAIGWIQLLKKLHQVGQPKTLKDGASKAKTSLAPDNKVIDEPELLRPNILRAEIRQKKLTVYKLPEMGKKVYQTVKDSWGAYQINGKAIALVAPPKELDLKFKSTSETCFWDTSQTFAQINIGILIPAIFRSTIYARLLKAGCQRHPKKQNIFYLPKEYNGKNRLSFTDINGRERFHKIRRYKTFRRASDTFKIYFHFAFRVDLARGLGTGFYIQILPTLMLFDEGDVPIIDERVNPMRKKIAYGWFNADWRDRFLAAEQLLTKTQEVSDDGIFISSGITLNSLFSIDEESFQKNTDDRLEDEDAGEIIEYDPEALTGFDEQ